MSTWKVLLLLIVAVVLVPMLLRGQEKKNSKIPAACVFEPDWRPTNLHDATLCVTEVGHANVAVTIEGTRNTLDEGGCKGPDCSRWRPRSYVRDGSRPAISSQNRLLQSCFTLIYQTQTNRFLNANRTDDGPTRIDLAAKRGRGIFH